jgi:phosphocarrier protein HPr
MPDVNLIVQHPSGLHARPASVFVKTASQFKSDIRVVFGEKDVNAKSILSVLTLGANQGANITIKAEGEDSDQALKALTELIESNFGEGG